MAKRRKSTSNSKTKETNCKEKSGSEVSAAQEEEGEDNNLCEERTNESLSRPMKPIGTDEKGNEVAEEGYEQTQDKMMPLDIQQMILGDLQSVGQGEEIIVSRENAVDVMEEEINEEMVEQGNVVESPREEEYEIHTEEDEEEELIFMNEEDESEENQYVIVVNSDFEANEDTEQEVVSIHNLSDLQEGSCEIITVVRESDYDSSQESLDEMEEGGCDNINAVIGTVDGIHCVKISQYNSEDESSNHDESFEKDIKVTEHDTEVACISNIVYNDNTNIQDCESSEIKVNVELPCNDKQIEQTCSKSKNTEATLSKSVSSKTEEEFENRFVDDNLKSNSKRASPEIRGISIEMSVEEGENNKLSNSNFDDRNKEINNSDIELTTKLVEDNLKLIPLHMTYDSNVDSNDVLVNKMQNDNSKIFKITPYSCIEKLKRIEVIEDKGIPEGSKDSNMCDSKPIGNNNFNVRDELLECAKIKCLNEKVIIAKENVQEDKITSNSYNSENCQSDTVQTMDLVSNSVKKEEELNLAIGNNLVETSNNIEEKMDISKEEIVLKDEEGKQNVFRSRSGSTDTTGSESGSNSSFSRRRSGRIRSIGVSKHIESEAGYKSTNTNSVAVVTSTTTPPVPGYESDKPVKVKSRWRRSSELEMGSGNKRQQESDTIHTNKAADSTMTRSGQPTTPPDSPPSDKEMEDVLSSFQRLDSNEYHTDRSKSKDAKRMVCDCTLTKEELARGDMGCGEDCLNRLLMIECGARCMLGERCANKRFQNLEYAKCEVFKTEMKGYGLKALEDIQEDTFLLEYVGEVLDPKEFRRRAKDYAKDKNLHFYFMALKSDSIIDATQKGNISRFINHSCDPNAETQKWTVNGELRVGFFSKRPITAGEEITFDYKYQRYGKEAQRCYCNSTSCRGWIGEDPEKENKWSDVKSRNKDRREKKKKEDKRTVKDVLNDIDLEEEIEKLVLKNRAQTLMLCRLIVRAEDHQSRMQLLNILQKGETACQRLFLDYHGLRLIWSWMMDPACDTTLKIEILETLSKLPIPNKTMLQDSRVLSVVEKWSTTASKITEAKDRSSTEDDSDKNDHEKDKQVKGSDSEKSSDDSNTNKFVEPEDVQERNKKKIVELANDLLKEWSSLKEVFRIPKKERIEQMKEHEREADKVCRDSSGKHEKSHDKHYSQDKHRNDYERRDRDKDRERDRDRDRDRKRGRDSPDSDRSKRPSKLDDRQSQLSKTERRQLFAIKVAQEEEERHRRQQECRWQEQVQQAAQELAQAQAQAQQEMEINYAPPQHPWMAYPPGHPNGIPPQHMEGQPMFGNMNHINAPPFLFNQGPHLHQHPPFLDPIHTPPFHNPVFNQPPPLPKQPLLPTPNQPPLLPTPPLPNQPLLPTPSLTGQQNLHQPLLPTPPLPNQPLGHQHLHQPLLPTPPLPNQPPGQQHLHQPLLPTPPLPTQPYPQAQPLLQTPPLPNQPYPCNQPMRPNPPLPNHPHPMSISHFTSQPPLPNVPPPLVITSQPPPVTPISFSQEVNSQVNFQSPLAPPQNQFTQPPPFTPQPPLPSLPPTPCPKPVLPVTQTVIPVTTTATPVPILLPTAVRLPPKWKSAKDAEGRTYYYHVKTRISQWEPPFWDYQKQQQQVSESESDSSESSDDDSSSEEEEQEEEKMEDEEPEPVEEVLPEDDLGCEEMGDSPYEPETMEMFEDIVEGTKKKRKDILVQERIISPRTADEIPDKLDKRKIRELKEKLRRQKAKEKLRQKQKNKLKGRSGTSKCEADTSSDPGRKIKDTFRLNMAGVIVHYLNAYRKPDCKFGKITNTEDFKHLARKLTHFVMLKELKHCRSVDELDCNDNVKHKARDFIKKYMAKFGSVYQRRDDD